MEQRQARLYGLIEEVYRDRDTASREEILQKLRELGSNGLISGLDPLPEGPIPRAALLVALDRIMSGVTGTAVWEGQSNPAEVVNPMEPAGGFTYSSDEVETVGSVEQTGTQELGVKMRGYPSIPDAHPVSREEVPVRLVELNAADLELLGERHLALLATLLPDGSPHTAVVWVGVENGLIEVNTNEGSEILENVRRDPRVSMSIYDEGNPTRVISISVQGRVIEATDQGAAEHLDRLAHKYTGQDRQAQGGGVPSERRWIIRIRPERISRYGY